MNGGKCIGCGKVVVADNAHVVFALDGDAMKPRMSLGSKQGGNGFGLSFDQVSYTITKTDRHMICVVKLGK